MSLPCYSKIHLNSADQKMIVAQLNQMTFTERPYVLVITGLEDQQLQALHHIESYFEHLDHSPFVYPIYIITTETNSSSRLNLVTSEAQVPKFFKIKERPLSSKENLIFSKMQLKQTNVAGLNHHEYKETLNNFAKAHREINLYTSKNSYLKTLISEIQANE